MKIEKPWGYEKIWAHTPHYAGKILFVKKGERLSLQHHQQKEETLYLQRGKAIVLLEDQNGLLKEHSLQADDSIHIACGKKNIELLRLMIAFSLKCQHHNSKT